MLKFIFFAGGSLLLGGAAQAACVANVAQGDGLNIRSEPSASASVVTTVPSKSCRLVIDYKSCDAQDKKWCGVYYNGKFGWVNKKYFTPKDQIERNGFNYYVIKSVYDADNRGGRGYNIRRSYSEDLDYGSPVKIKSFYYDNAASKFVYPGGPSATMCVAAVAEVMIGAINKYSIETGDVSVFSKLPPAHFSADAGVRHIRTHIWEYSDLGSKGAAHALERFDIGKQRAWSELTPGDFIKLNRDSGPGHSTIFIDYVDLFGRPLQVYSEQHAAGFRYFSSQGSGEDRNGNPVSSGLSFRTEFFNGKCGDQNQKKLGRCRVSGPNGRYGVNVGTMFHPSKWGVVGATYRNELANKEHIRLTGKSIRSGTATLLNSSNGSWLKKAVEDALAVQLKPDAYPEFKE